MTATITTTEFYVMRACCRVKAMSIATGLKLAASVLVALTSFAAPVVADGFPIDPEIVERIPPRLPGALRRIREPTQIEIGRKLFEQETFGGNGRTCATCHPRTNNFTIDVPFISRLRPDDPLFVFERVPELAGLENGPALRTKGLICENLDGFDQPCVLRSVPHTLGLSQQFATQAPFPLVDALGWGGDGSPGDGSLRNFAVGAVVQHFPKTLNRVEGVDFRLPTATELDALEAFQLSLGRSTTPVTDPALPGALVFVDPDVTAGQVLFTKMPSRQGTRGCGGCHTGGSVSANSQRATGANRVANATVCSFPGVPGDGAFGQTSVVVEDRSAFCTNGATGPVTFRGNEFFTVPPTIEASFTPPFFHNNSADTLEEVVDFYRDDAFARSITGANNPFVIDDAQRNQIAVFVRVLGVLEKIRSATAALKSLSDQRLPARLVVIGDARRDVGDAIKLLKEGNLRVYQNTALPALNQAWSNVVVLRPDRALANLEVARGLIVN